MMVHGDGASRVLMCTCNKGTRAFIYLTRVSSYVDRFDPDLVCMVNKELILRH